MVKKLRFQESRTEKCPRMANLLGKWVFEAIDVLVVTILAAAMIWLQWLLQSVPA